VCIWDFMRIWLSQFPDRIKMYFIGLVLNDVVYQIGNSLKIILFTASMGDVM
jgi:hypothetical protein